MAASTSLLTLEQFNAQYANEHGYEYWFGEVVQKGMPTSLHGLLQLILGEFVHKLGYFSGSEIDPRIDPNWQPRPDVIATLEIEQPYPTKPVDIVAEVLSPDDPMTKVFEKCRNYARIGIPQIFIFDPARTAWEWNQENDNLERIHVLRLRNGSTLDVNDIWAEMESRMRPRSGTP